MTKSPLTTQQKQASPTVFNKIAYTAFVALAVFMWLFSKDKMLATSHLGIALVFDPFNPAVPWNKRPLYQKVWLIAHTTILFALFAYVLLSK